jgi:hypothetical protein
MYGKQIQLQKLGFCKLICGLWFLYMNVIAPSLTKHFLSASGCSSALEPGGVEILG